MASHKATTLGALAGAHAGRAALILGGGPSLITDRLDAAHAYPDAVLFSVNHHGLLLERPDLFPVRQALGEYAPGFVRCDYAAAIDEWPKFFPGVVEFTAVRKIEPRDGADVRVLEYPRGTGSSAMFAAWAAYIMGCGPIVLCGIGCYDDPRGTYWHDPRADSSGNSSPGRHHVNEWAVRLPQFMAPEFVQVASGPLVDVFGPIEPRDLSTRPDVLPELSLRFRRKTEVGGRVYREDETDVFPYHQARWLIAAERADLE